MNSPFNLKRHCVEDMSSSVLVGIGTESGNFTKKHFCVSLRNGRHGYLKLAPQTGHIITSAAARQRRCVFSRENHRSRYNEGKCRP